MKKPTTKLAIIADALFGALFVVVLTGGIIWLGMAV